MRVDPPAHGSEQHAATYLAGDPSLIGLDRIVDTVPATESRKLDVSAFWAANLGTGLASCHIAEEAA